MKTKFLISILVALAVAIGYAPSVKAAPFLRVWDTFEHGFTVGKVGSSAN